VRDFRENIPFVQIEENQKKPFSKYERGFEEKADYILIPLGVVIGNKGKEKSERKRAPHVLLEG